MKHPHIAILLPIHNGLSFTRKCLSSLERALAYRGLDRGAFSIVVIDDGSTDGSPQWIEANYPESIILAGDGNLWWSGGINRGIEYALSHPHVSHILMWNNDIHIDSSYLFILYQVALARPDDTLIGSKIYYADRPLVIWAMGGVFNKTTGVKYPYGNLQTDSEIYDEPFEADWLPGMGTLVHRKVFERIGVIDARAFPQYHGDSDFTFRAKQAGYRLLVLPELRIWNDKSNSGMRHLGSFRMLIRSLYDIRSNNNISKDLMFYRRHATSAFAYHAIFKKYLVYIGGFVKWKLLGLVGIRGAPRL